MTNAKLNVLLATALDKAGSDRAQAARIMKRFALAQALSCEEQLTDDDTRIVAAAAALYELNDPAENPAEDGKEFQPIVITTYVKDLLDDANLPVFEASAVGSLVAMQKHGRKIENDLHRLLLDIDTLVRLDSNPDTTAADAEKALETLTHESAKRRLSLMYGLTTE